MMRGQQIYRLSYWIAATIIAAVFLLGSYKIFDPSEFIHAVCSFDLLPEVLIKPVAYLISWFEFICAVSLLCVPRFRRAALWGALVLLAVFTLVIAISLLRGLEIGCGCFGYMDSEQLIHWADAGRNGALMVLVGLALLMQKRMNV